MKIAEEKQYEEVSVKLVHQTEKAFLLAFEEMKWSEFWVPRSVVEDEDCFDEDGGEASVETWWLERNGLL